MLNNVLQLTLALLSVAIFSCSPPDTEKRVTAAQYLDQYHEQWLPLYRESAEAAWISNTRIVPDDTTNAYRSQQADEALSAFTGSRENIENATYYLEQGEELAEIEKKQLESILYRAADNPATVEELVKLRIAAENAQTEKLFGFDFTLGDQSVSTNEIDDILRTENDLNQRLRAWEASKEVGAALKDGLEELRELRNQTVSALDYKDYFAYQVSDYGMTSTEMLALCDQMINDIWPLYRELHTYARYQLAERFGEPVPDYLPAHWLPNRWGQDWSAMLQVSGLDLDEELSEKEPEWLVKQAERFYISLGFDPLPPSFYSKSSLYPLPDSVGYKKNNHASAWHLDLQDDIRCLMSVVPNAEWYETTHHELGHIYYYLAYTNPDVPPLLRGGANRAFHEAVGSLMGLAAMQKPFLEGLDLVPQGAQTDEIQLLLKEALNYIVFIPFSAGVMTHFEAQLYQDNTSKDSFNESWWSLVKKYQGIVPPDLRGEEYCDAASKTHINNDAAQYYDYALSYAILFQLHQHIASNILAQDPRSTNYRGSTAVGEFLKSILTPGSSVDWRQLLKETTGSDLNAKAMMEYFQPLMAYLKEQNQGREHVLGESP